MATKQETKKVNKSLQYTGTVVGNKADKTLRVRVETKMAHPLYKKIIRRHKNYLVHSVEKIELGSIVLFKETRPISKSKKWVIIKVLSEKK